MDKNKIAVAVFDNHARFYQQKYMDTSLYHAAFDLFCEKLPQPDATILDVACGPGNITQYLLKKEPRLQITGIDLAPNMIALARQHNPAARFRVADGRAIKSLGKTYDGILCGFLFPYLTKEEAVQFIADAALVLNENGVLYLSTMEDDYEKSGITKSSKGDEVYLYYHEQCYLVAALTENGFRLIYQHHQDFPATAMTDLILIAVKMA